MADRAYMFEAGVLIGTIDYDPDATPDQPGYDLIRGIDTNQTFTIEVDGKTYRGVEIRSKDDV